LPVLDTEDAEVLQEQGVTGEEEEKNEVEEEGNEEDELVSNDDIEHRVNILHQVVHDASDFRDHVNI
jgi:hypothetical protein